VTLLFKTQDFFKTGIEITFYRSLAYNEISVLIILFQYNVEVLNLIVTLTAVFVIITKAFLPIPFVIAQTAALIIASTVTLAFILGFTISSFKILFVTQLYFVFLQDPNQLARNVLIVSLIVAAGPNIIVGICLSLLGINALPVVKLATAHTGASESSESFTFIYMIFWAILCVIMLVVVVYYIPYYLKNIIKNNAAIQAGEVYSAKKNPDLKKLLLVFIILLCFLVILWIDNMIHDIDCRMFLPSYTLSLVPTTMLLLFTVDTEIGKFVKKVISVKLYELQICQHSARVAPSLQEPA
jgi:hypothetical protein